MASTDSFTVQFSFQGQTVDGLATVQSTAQELIETARTALFGGEDNNSGTSHELKLLFKGKRLEGGSSNNSFVFSSIPTKTPKIIVLATTAKTVSEVQSRRSDPTIRGFDNERSQSNDPQERLLLANGYWGPLLSRQHKDYKFCRFEACTWQSFGHRSVDSTPHDFAARQLLEQLATDPGIVAILQERELVVTTLGEMDPIDDRLMHQTQQQKGACLLGYNTNAGARIDLKLRTDDLKGFRPYPELVATLIHELSHNWVSDHNLLFWTNYGQMRVEYLCRHVLGSLAGVLVRGKTTAQLAGLPSTLNSMTDIFNFVMKDLTHEMAQHGLDARLAATSIRDRCDEWERKAGCRGHVLGGSGNSSSRTSGRNDDAATTQSTPTLNARDLALDAAERRRQNKPDDDSNKK